MFILWQPIWWRKWTIIWWVSCSKTCFLPLSGEFLDILLCKAEVLTRFSCHHSISANRVQRSSTGRRLMMLDSFPWWCTHQASQQLIPLPISPLHLTQWFQWPLGTMTKIHNLIRSGDILVLPLLPNFAEILLIFFPNYLPGSLKYCSDKKCDIEAWLFVFI